MWDEYYGLSGKTDEVVAGEEVYGAFGNAAGAGHGELFVFVLGWLGCHHLVS